MLIYFIFPLIVVLIGLLIEYWVIQPLRKNGIPISFQTTVSSIIQRMTSFIKPDKINEESSPSEKKTSLNRILKSKLGIGITLIIFLLLLTASYFLIKANQKPVYTYPTPIRYSIAIGDNLNKVIDIDQTHEYVFTSSSNKIVAITIRRIRTTDEAKRNLRVNLYDENYVYLFEESILADTTDPAEKTIEFAPEIGVNYYLEIYLGSSPSNDYFGANYIISLEYK